MEQVGYVCKIIDDKAEVEVRRISSCGGGCSSCGGSCNVPSIIVVMNNLINAEVGDYVEIRAKSKNIIKYALIVYMIPFAMLILGIILGMNLFQSMNMSNYETYGFMIGLIFLVISFTIVRRIDKSIEKKNENTMEMVRIIK
ncbi:MAG: SoxR reducing system RseC family protein [Tissierellia bacterium]|nr:SoxR reducing system RseC family protein [Tissierellia bacterium]